MRNALITGITGQDGAYLAKFLLEKDYKVFGTYRRLSTPNFWRLQELNIYEDINLISADLIDMSSMIEAIELSKPREVYNLAAQSHVGASFEQPIATAEITGISVPRILEVKKKKILQSGFIRHQQANFMAADIQNHRMKTHLSCPRVLTLRQSYMHIG